MESTASYPVLGNFRDNETFLNHAVQLLRLGRREIGVERLRELERHVLATGETKSVATLLPRIRAEIGSHSVEGLDMVRLLKSHGSKVLGLVASDGRRCPSLGPTLATLVAEYPGPFERSIVVSDSDTFREVLKSATADSPDRAVISSSALSHTSVVGQPQPFTYVLRPAREGGLAEMSHLVAHGALKRLLFLASASDLDTSDTRTLVRAGIRDGSEMLLTFRSISDHLKYESGASSDGHRPRPESEGLAIIAHPERKLECMHWLVKNAATIARFRHIFATGTTGQWVKRFLEALGLSPERVICLSSGPHGGDEQMLGPLFGHRCHHVVFLIDPQWPPPHEAAIFSLLRVCTTPDLSINLRLNEQSASVWIESFATAV
jgi:methylglyoxal synthase